ncbi:MAG TPA: ATP-dependent RecD-like DNA helicase [Kiritimatiellia bacterium]|nr:ATP-dependent RecD-like DNA helicase [Kiritimatiellia bacterium]HRU71458.1 ATP-dependent RecD-like DNA helicase [Kiritimatiellia bacterium]
MNAHPQHRETQTADADTVPLEVVTGTVESIVYRNDETGYTVCSVKTHGGGVRQRDTVVTVVGSCAAMWEGEELHAEGQWIRHPSHGQQFQAKTITCITPTSTEGLRRYLASGMIKGIGPKFAQRIVDHFGERTLEVIEKESGRLREVEGIGEGRRKLIKESWTEQRGVREIMIFLQSHGIGTAKASRIYRQYGADAIAVVKRNPYRLCEEVWGIGFKTADSIALSVGIPHDSEIRARAGLIYTLQTEADEGHCFTLDSDLLLHAQELLGISVEILGDALAKEFEKGTLVKEENRIYLRDLYRAESRVAATLRRLLDAPPPFAPIDADRAIPWAENKMGLNLAPLQREALRNAVTSKVSIITGGPGVGKTTIIRALTEIFGVRKLVVRLAAPTGRAAKRMSEATGREAQTIHRLLKFNPNIGGFEFNLDNRMSGDCFILDETSMIDIRLMDQFLQALPDSATLVLVGDTDQLPSVGPGNVLRDLIASGAIPCCRLDTIFRQDTTGLIVRNAHHVNRGEPLETSTGDSDFYFVETGEPEKIIARTVDLMTKRIPLKFKLDPLTDVQVLTPMRRNLLGSENLNDVIQAAVNPSGPSLVRGCTHFRVNDRVMQLRNNYDKEVFNGDIGFIKQVDEEDRALVVLFDGRPVRYAQSELDELVLAYACSIHKSQGSEYPAVIVLLHTQHYKLLQRNLLYTAITRGKRLVLVVGSSRALHIAIKANQVRERRTSLRERLQVIPLLSPA